MIRWSYWQSDADECALLAYFEKREWAHLYLAHWVYRACQEVALRKYILLAYHHSGELLGVIALDKDARLLVDATTTLSLGADGAWLILAQWPKPYCLIGTPTELFWLEQRYERSMHFIGVNYFSMTINPQAMRNFSLVTPDAIDFVPSTLADFSTLLTLEIGYQQEEVMVAKHHLLSENAIATHFRRRLTQEEGYHLQYKEHILSKASINVAGRAYDQVAGVYTTPRLRGKGLAKILFYHLFQLYIVRNKALVLFVKQENRSALRLYQSVGFREKQTYRISYL